MLIRIFTVIGSYFERENKTIDVTIIGLSFGRYALKNTWLCRVKQLC
ncbi:MAG: hypothetical protein KBC72_08550 [Acinetobacter sp.]|nr:hypothetical protein [Acinetobacter sp.]MBP9787597.1 hypothetical protein [Acinetobacter sp.]